MENSTVTESAPPKKQGSAVSVIIPWVLCFVLLVGAGAGYVYMTNISKGATSSKPTANMCQGVKIVFFPGGTEKDPFASVVYKGAQAAEAMLGATVSYVWSDWNTDKMVAQFKDAIDTSPDAIAMMGHPGADALSALIDEAERKNIIVTLQNVDIPTIREKYISNGFGYAGQDVYGAGYQLGTGAVRKYNLVAGDEALVPGLFNKTGAMAARARRTDGIVDGLKKAGVVVHTVDVPAEVEKDYTSDVSYQWFSEQINKYPQSKVLLVDHHGGVTPAVAAHLKRMGKKPNELPYGGFDLSTETIKYIKEGYIGLISDQQPYLQGFLPILQSCMTKKYEFAGLYVDTGVGLIDSSNVDLVAGLAEQGIR
jgi:simple sugar transport system substrate-binding protein